MRRKLIQVHCLKPRLENCDHCDGISSEINTFYKELTEGGRYFEFQTYLECCRDQVGDVVDWCNLEDYSETEKMVKVGGVLCRQIKGYVAKKER